MVKITITTTTTIIIKSALRGIGNKRVYNMLYIVRTSGVPFRAVLNRIMNFSF